MNGPIGYVVDCVIDGVVMIENCAPLQHRMRALTNNGIWKWEVKYYNRMIYVLQVLVYYDFHLQLRKRTLW